MGFFFRRKKNKEASEDIKAPDAEKNLHTSKEEAEESSVESTDQSSDTLQNLTEHNVTETTPIETVAVDTEINEQIHTKPTTLDKGLAKSSNSLLGSLSDIFSSGIEFSEDIYEELEDTLISADIGVEASMSMIEGLRENAKSQKLKTAQSVVECLQQQAQDELSIAEKSWNFNLKPYVIMMVGVNGVGKTTSTAKIARHFQKQGKRVMLAAADTFRAAATEQLVEWGQRLDIPVIHQAQGADAAAVAHDAFNAALARNSDILIIDTAGRLHTQTDLMEQLAKVTRVLRKIDADTPHEVMQVLDATTGQNALSQLSHFKDSAGVTSICLTKLDGSAKGGVATSLAKKYNMPIRFIGIGESFDDMQAFSAKSFAKALIPDVED